MSTKAVRINDATSKAGIAKGDMKLEVSSSPSRMLTAPRSSTGGSGGGRTSRRLA